MSFPESDIGRALQQGKCEIFDVEKEIHYHVKVGNNEYDVTQAQAEKCLKQIGEKDPTKVLKGIQAQLLTDAGGSISAVRESALMKKSEGSADTDKGPKIKGSVRRAFCHFSHFPFFGSFSALGRIGYNIVKLTKGTFQTLSSPSNTEAQALGKKRAISALKEIGRGAYEFIPIFGTIAAVIVDDYNDEQLTKKANKLAHEGKIQEAIEVMVQALEPLNGFITITQSLIQKGKHDAATEIYLTLAEPKNQKIQVHLNLWTAYDLVKFYANNPTEENLDKASKLVKVIKQFGGDTSGGGWGREPPGIEAERYLNERLQLIKNVRDLK